jgi:predicted  nucleic acid-binding Zn-ribbon protein
LKLKEFTESDVKKQIDLLVKLQEKDRLLEKLEGQISGGPKRLKDLESQLESLEESYKAHKDRIQELLKTQRQYEGEIEDGIAHIRKSRGRLMSIKNNKEYHALIREIEETEKDNAAKEDKVIACLEELEKLNEELGDSENALASMGKSIDKDKRVIEEEVASMEKELAAVSAEKEALVQAIESPLLAKYKRIRTGSGGVALSLVNDATCSECHMSIPPQMYNELQRQDALQQCPHCQRMIYWKEVEPTE